MTPTSNDRIATARLIVQKLRVIDDARATLVQGLQELEELLEEDMQPEYELREVQERRVTARHATEWLLTYRLRWEGYLQARRSTNNYSTADD